MNLSVSGGIVSLAALCAMFNGGSLVLFSGSLPTTPETAESGTELVLFTFSGAAFGTPVHGTGSATGFVTATATFTNASPNPLAAGTAGWGRAFVSGATISSASGIGDFTVGTSATDIILGSTTITLGVPVDMTSFTVSLPVV